MKKKNRSAKSIIKQNKRLVEKEFLGFFEKGFSDNEKFILRISKKELYSKKGSFKDFFNYNEFRNLLGDLKLEDDTILNDNLVFFRIQDKKDLLSKYSDNKNKSLLNFGYNFKEVYSPQKNDLFFGEDLYLYNRVREGKKYFLHNSFATLQDKEKESLRLINFGDIQNYISYEKEKQLNKNFSISKRILFNGLQNLNSLFENKNLASSNTYYMVVR